MQDYTRRFKTANNFLLHIVGPSPIESTKYRKGMNGYIASDPASTDKCENKACQQVLAFLYVNNTDQTTYRSLVTGLQMQQLLLKSQNNFGREQCVEQTQVQLRKCPKADINNDLQENIHKPLTLSLLKRMFAAIAVVRKDTNCHLLKILKTEGRMGK